MRTSLHIRLSGMVLLLCLLAACSASNTPMAGDWMAAVDFGRIGFTVASDGASISVSRYDLNQFDCAGTTISAGVQHETQPAQAIENGSFHDNVNLNVEGTQIIDLIVTFSESGQWANGTY
ncbi:MAG: hypothetical protein PVG63_07135, partial [Anaerolineales bacterium]